MAGESIATTEYNNLLTALEAARAARGRASLNLLRAPAASNTVSSEIIEDNIGKLTSADEGLKYTTHPINYTSPNEFKWNHTANWSGTNGGTAALQGDGTVLCTCTAAWQGIYWVQTWAATWKYVSITYKSTVPVSIHIEGNGAGGQVFPACSDWTSVTFTQDRTAGAVSNALVLYLQAAGTMYVRDVYVSAGTFYGPGYGGTIYREHLNRIDQMRIDWAENVLCTSCSNICYSTCTGACGGCSNCSSTCAGCAGCSGCSGCSGNCASCSGGLWCVSCWGCAGCSGCGGCGGCSGNCQTACGGNCSTSCSTVCYTGCSTICYTGCTAHCNTACTTNSRFGVPAQA